METDRSNEIRGESVYQPLKTPERFSVWKVLVGQGKGTKPGITAVKSSGNAFPTHRHPLQEAGLVSRKCEPDTKKD